MTAKRFVYPSIGSISSGTMRTKDLLDTFSGELRHQMRRRRLARDQRKRYNRLLADAANIVQRRYPPQGAQMVVDDLFDALDEIAPPYTYFGAIEGDGADYGYWPAIDNHDGDCAPPRLAAGDPIDREHWGEDVLLVNDHGNVECGYVDRKGKFHEYWSAV